MSVDKENKSDIALKILVFVIVLGLGYYLGGMKNNIQQSTELMGTAKYQEKKKELIGEETDLLMEHDLGIIKALNCYTNQDRKKGYMIFGYLCIGTELDRTAKAILRQKSVSMYSVDRAQDFVYFSRYFFDQQHIRHLSEQEKNAFIDLAYTFNDRPSARNGNPIQASELSNYLYSWREDKEVNMAMASTIHGSFKFDLEDLIHQ